MGLISSRTKRMPNKVLENSIRNGDHRGIEFRVEADGIVDISSSLTTTLLAGIEVTQ